MVNFNMAPVDFGFFEVFGVKPTAGRLFSRDHGPDGALTDPKGAAAPSVIINETGGAQPRLFRPQGRRRSPDALGQPPARRDGLPATR